MLSCFRYIKDKDIVTLIDKGKLAERLGRKAKRV